MENKKEPIKIKLSTAILIFIIFILIVTIIGIIFYYKIKYNTNATQNKITENNSQMEIEKNLNEENDKENNSDNEIQKIDTNTELIQKLNSYIPAIDYKIEKNAYQDKKITLNELKNDFILRVAFTKLTLKDEDKKKISDEYDLDTGWYAFDANILQNKVKELYGKNANVPNQDFDDGAGLACNYKDGKYNVGSGGGTGEGLIQVSKMIEAYSQNNEIYIITKNATYVFTDENPKGSLYTDSTLVKKIKDYKDEKYDSMDGNKIAENIIKNDENVMTKYKHTFEKDENGNYYWVSTEPVK